MSFEELIRFIRDHQSISAKILITEATRLEDDLGITGDDGVELIESIERHFHISFAGENGSLRSVFGLKNHEYLFHSEEVTFGKLFGFSVENVHPLTVGQLHQVIRSLINTDIC